MIERIEILLHGKVQIVRNDRENRNLVACKESISSWDGKDDTAGYVTSST